MIQLIFDKKEEDRSSKIRRKIPNVIRDDKCITILRKILLAIRTPFDFMRLADLQRTGRIFIISFGSMSIEWSIKV